MSETSGAPSPPVQATSPTLLLFDVNETLSDMAPLADRFTDVGAPAQLARTWFAGLLRDGFALTVAGVNPAFADLAADGLRISLGGLELDRPVDDAVAHIMTGLTELGVHPDVPSGIESLADLGLRLATLSNGSASIAQQLLSTAGLDRRFERFLSVDAAGIWKPARDAYAYAVRELGSAPGEAMLVAAHPWDTDGADRAGLQSAWINRAGQRFPEYFNPPTVQVRSLTHLADQLAEDRGSSRDRV